MTEKEFDPKTDELRDEFLTDAPAEEVWKKRDPTVRGGLRRAYVWVLLTPVERKEFTTAVARYLTWFRALKCAENAWFLQKARIATASEKLAEAREAQITCTQKICKKYGLPAYAALEINRAGYVTAYFGAFESQIQWVSRKLSEMGVIYNVQCSDPLRPRETPAGMPLPTADHLDEGTAAE